MGELSSARQALEATPVAPGNEATRAKLMRAGDQVQRDEGWTRTFCRCNLMSLSTLMKFQHNLRTSRRGAAGGPSGMTAEHLRVLLDSPSCTSLLGEAASQLAQGNIPEEVVSVIRLGRMTVLQKTRRRSSRLSLVMSSGALWQGPSPTTCETG